MARRDRSTFVVGPSRRGRPRRRSSLRPCCAGTRAAVPPDPCPRVVHPRRRRCRRRRPRAARSAVAGDRGRARTRCGRAVADRLADGHRVRRGLGDRPHRGLTLATRRPRARTCAGATSRPRSWCSRWPASRSRSRQVERPTRVRGRGRAAVGCAALRPRRRWRGPASRSWSRPTGRQPGSSDRSPTSPRAAKGSCCSRPTPRSPSSATLGARLLAPGARHRRSRRARRRRSASGAPSTIPPSRWPSPRSTGASSRPTVRCASSSPPPTTRWSAPSCSALRPDDSGELELPRAGGNESYAHETRLVNCSRHRRLGRGQRIGLAARRRLHSSSRWSPCRDVTERTNLRQQLLQAQKMESVAGWPAASPTTSTTCCR